MNCTPIRPLLPLLSYGELPANEADAIRAHLADCAACRKELAEFQHVRAALGCPKVPVVHVDLPRLFHEAADRQARRVRRWHRAGVAVTGIAAALLLIAVLRLEIRVETQQLTLRWGAVPVQDLAQAEQVVVRADPAALAALQERVHVLDDLLHAVIIDIADRDERQAQRLARLFERLEEVRVQNGRRWSETERNVAAMHAAMLVRPPRGEKP
ncbi:MAG TPA: zf-HC2 domain-containing protein [Gemmataceae bacterium]|nr:zf-HC2 domain-containing protein [Gemmataceae bacterium]